MTLIWGALDEREIESSLILRYSDLEDKRVERPPVCCSESSMSGAPRRIAQAARPGEVDDRGVPPRPWLARYVRSVGARRDCLGLIAVFEFDTSARETGGDLHAIRPRAWLKVLEYARTRARTVIRIRWLEQRRLTLFGLRLRRSL